MRLPRKNLGLHSPKSLASFVSLLALGCGGWAVSSDPPQKTDAGPNVCEEEATGADVRQPGSVPTDYPRGLRVVGNRIEDADGNRIFLRGVNRSGSEYKCVQGGPVFDGPDDEDSIIAMKSWGINAVRVPLNETCWLSLNGVACRYAGKRYRDAIGTYVERLHRYGLVPILDLHWAAPGEHIASALTPMPNADHSADFWRSVANTFLDDDGVIFEPFNEPFPDLNRDTPEAWSCWRDGCEVMQYGSAEPYAAAGMQAMVDAIRETGAQHLILLGGIQYSNALTEWLSHKPDDPLENLGVAWHIYNNNRCNNEDCWNDVPATLAATLPVVATEIGQNDCAGEAFLKPLMQFVDEHGAGYLAWSWNALGACVPTIPRMQQGAPWALITDYAAPEPNSDYARTFYDHVQEVTP